jgi:uracil-DNA glycosylase family 4
MTKLEPIEVLRKIAGELDHLDVDCYRKHAQNPVEPVLGLGSSTARWCFFGRDPGEQEVRSQRPFVGEAGQKIRAVMREASLDDDDVFWMNTVPYKPKGNKPWSVAVRRRCQPALLELLLCWQGSRVVAFGEAAFRWFGMTSSTAHAEINQFWKRSDRYHSELEVAIEHPGFRPRTFTLCPVPHPSGANARWAKSFPDLFKARLRPHQTEQ